MVTVPTNAPSLTSLRRQRRGFTSGITIAMTIPIWAISCSTCGAHRVPGVLFLSEDNYVCGRYGDRTLAKYRDMAEKQLGTACPTGIGEAQSLLASVTQDWLDEFERIQLMLRFSGRLRQLHGD